MAILDINDLFSFLQGWISNNGEKVWTIWLQKGGWEGWAQVEIMSAMTGNNISVQREMAIYTDPKKAVDFIVNFQSPDVKKQICLELKCESLFQSSQDGRVHSDNKIWEKVANDLAKLYNERTPYYKETQALAAAIVFSPQAYEALQSRLGLILVKIDLGQDRFLALGAKKIDCL